MVETKKEKLDQVLAKFMQVGQVKAVGIVSVEGLLITSIMPPDMNQRIVGALCSTIIASALRAIGGYDIIFCGRQAIDGDTAQVGPEVAEFLNLPQITYVSKLEIKGRKVIAQRTVEDGYYVVEAKMPVLLTAIKGESEPRYPSVQGI